MWNEAAYYVIVSPCSSAEHGPSSETPTGIYGAAEPAETNDGVNGTAAGAVPGLCAAHAFSPPPPGSPSPPTGSCGAAEPAETDDGVGGTAATA